MNKRTMLEHAINVLKNVSFDSKLFYKELQKAMDGLLPYYVEELMDWVKDYLEDKPSLKAELALLDFEIVEEFAL